MFKFGDKVQTTRRGETWEADEDGVVIWDSGANGVTRVWFHLQEDWQNVPASHLALAVPPVVADTPLQPGAVMFQIGDRVHAVRGSDKWNIGDEGVIVEPTDKFGMAQVWIHDREEAHFISASGSANCFVRIAPPAPNTPPASDSERRRAAQYESAQVLLRGATPDEVQAVIRLLMGMDRPVEQDVIAADITRRLLDLAPAPDAGNPDDLKLPAVVERLAERLAQQEARIGELRKRALWGQGEWRKERARAAHWHDAACKQRDVLHSIAQRAEEDGDSAVCTLIAIQAREGLKIGPEEPVSAGSHSLSELEANLAVRHAKPDNPQPDPAARQGAIRVIRANLFELERLRDGADVRYVDGVVEQTVFNAKSSRIALLIEEALDALGKLEAPHESDAPARRRNVSAHVRAYLKEVRRMVQNPSVHASSDVVEHVDAAMARLNDLDAL